MNSVKLDQNDLYRVSLRKWSSQGKYIRTGFYDGEKSRNVYLHHYLIGFPLNGLEVDHINRNPLDNRKENLRFVTRQENMKNRAPGAGCYWDKDRGNWVSQLMINGKNTYLGSFKTKIEAMKKTAMQRRKK